MLARAAIRDVGRVMGMGYGEVDQIAKTIPNQLGIKLEEALEISTELKARVDADANVARLIGLAQQLEGVARNASTHAAGVVISREPLTELMPLQKATNSDALMTQYEMHAVEALGLLKFDFLGLSNLTILRRAVDLVRETRGVSIDLEQIPLDDGRTFELLASGETTGVFQLESAGMRRYIKELQPTSVYDLAAMVALFRPGPMDNIPAYIRRKHGHEAVTYLHPLLEPYLNKTYGIFVYQEDIMAAAIALGGFTGPEADTLGYSIRKKKSAVLRSMREKFVKQAAERGVPAADDRRGLHGVRTVRAVRVQQGPRHLLRPHRVPDGLPQGELHGRVHGERAHGRPRHGRTVAAAIAECRRMGIEVRPPDVHRSGVEFTVEGDAIRFGLLAVKNVGEGAIESIIASRTEGGDFRSLADFCGRIDLRLANKRVLESLAKVGALNAFGHPAQVLAGLDDAIAAAQATQRDRISGQTSLFDVTSDDVPVLERPLPNVSEEPVRGRLAWEKELLGLYLSDHPLGALADEIGRYVTAYSGDLKDESLDQQRVVIGGIVTGFRTIVTKSKQTMGVATLEDLQGTLEVIVFPRLYEQTAATWAEGSILLVAGRVDHKGDENPLLADLVTEWEAAIARGPEAFARDVAAGDRPRRSGRPGWTGAGNGNGGAGTGNGYPAGAGAPGRGNGYPAGAGAPGRGNGYANGSGAGNGYPAGNGAGNGSGAGAGYGAPNGNGSGGNGHAPGGGQAPEAPHPVYAGSAPSAAARPIAPGAPGTRATVPFVSPLRAGAAPLSPDPVATRIVAAGIRPAEPVPTYLEPAGAALAGPERDEEPPLPDEARAAASLAAGASTAPASAGPDTVLHVRFSPAAGADRLVTAMEAFKTLLRDRPGGTRVILHVPAASGDPLPMELRRGVAYDGDLLAEIQRRLGSGLVEVHLA